MHADEFMEKVRNPDAWRNQARALRSSADAVWDSIPVSVGPKLRSAKEGENEADMNAAIDSWIELLQISKMLYGLSLENALKAWIIEHSPEKVTIAVSMNGRGEAVGAEIKSVGVQLSAGGHNLEELAKAAGLFESRTSLCRDNSYLVAGLRHLSDVVLWQGRYPVPRKSGEPEVVGQGVPWQNFAHHVRDWVDPLLDELLEASGQKRA